MSNVIPMPRLEIRRARTEDREAVSRMVAGVWSEIYAHHLPAGSADSGNDAHIAELIGDPGQNGWVAVLGKRIVGYCSTTGNCIEQVWVGAAMRRQGIGTELTRRAIDTIRSRGFAFAQMGCEDFNAGARAFLEAGNWNCIASEARPMANGRSYDARVYSRSLA
jgi:ribosomal protein S18 acetylase RimI-like enzyme